MCNTLPRITGVGLSRVIMVSGDFIIILSRVDAKPPCRQPAVMRSGLDLCELTRRNRLLYGDDRKLHESLHHLCQLWRYL